MSKYHIVWNDDRTEGYITNDASDAAAASGNRPVQLESVLATAFRETYGGTDHKRTVQVATIHPELSERAKALLRRIEQGHWYSTESDRTPKAMKELIDHELVHTTGRVKVIEGAYVATGHQRFHMDRAPDEFGEYQ